MNAYLLPGVMGLLIGLLLHWTGFSRSEGIQDALGLRRSVALRSGLSAVGYAMALTALLCWLAVIDVDTIEVTPLSAGALIGGAVLGIAAGLSGFTPMTAFAGLGGGKVLEALCAIAGCLGMCLLLPAFSDFLLPLQTTRPYSPTTLFKLTLDEPYLLGGGFLGQGCAGLLLVAIAICIPSPRAAIIPDEVIAEQAEDTPVPEPEEAPGETFVAILPGEEALVVDTAMDEQDQTAEQSTDLSEVPEPPPSVAEDEPEEDEDREET